ncbi:hypothetical protein GCM10029963_43070 [Micromonospora andamanensis]
MLRPALWSALLAAVASTVLAAPAYAEPGIPVTVPDTGSRPVVTGPIQLPGAPAGTNPGLVPPTLGTPGASALETQINAAEARVAELGTRLLELEQQRNEVQTQFVTAERDLEFARGRSSRRSSAPTRPPPRRSRPPPRCHPAASPPTSVTWICSAGRTGERRSSTPPLRPPVS